MISSHSLPEYIEVTNELNNNLKSNYSAAEMHGLICGLICSHGDIAETRLHKIIFGDQKKITSLAILEQLYTASFQQILEFSFDFNLLLPNDDVKINQRAEALGLWCQGFLIGLEDGKVSTKNRLSQDVVEAINDITEIAQISYDDIADTEEDETAYLELVEYVRLAVLMIFHELRPDNSTHNKDENLH